MNCDEKESKQQKSNTDKLLQVNKFNLLNQKLHIFDYKLQILSIFWEWLIPKFSRYNLEKNLRPFCTIIQIVTAEIKRILHLCWFGIIKQFMSPQRTIRITNGLEEQNPVFKGLDTWKLSFQAISREDQVSSFFWNKDNMILKFSRVKSLKFRV